MIRRDGLTAARPARRRSSLTVAALLTVSLLGAAACGAQDSTDPGESSTESVEDDRGEDGNAPTDTPTSDPSAEGSVRNDPAPAVGELHGAVCDGVVVIDRRPFDDPTLHAIAATDALAAMADVVPPDAADAVTVLRDAFSSSAGDTVLVGPSSIDRIDARLAAAQLHELTHTGCGFDTAEITTTDTGPIDVPTLLSAGTTSIRLVNGGTVGDQELLVRSRDGSVLAGVRIEAGGASATVVELVPGDYSIEWSADDGTPIITSVVVE